MPAQEQPALYDRLGGVYNIATVVDDFIDRIMVDPRLNANPRVDEAHHRVSPPGFKYLVTEMVCEASGGPQHYSGRSMGDSHRHLMISQEEWQAFLEDFQQSLDKFEVPRLEQEELMALLESTREAIVVSPFQEGPMAATSRELESRHLTTAEPVVHLTTRWDRDIRRGECRPHSLFLCVFTGDASIFPGCHHERMSSRDCPVGELGGQKPCR